MEKNRLRWEPALSVSRLKEHMKCPLQFRLHVVDGYRDPASRATALGTLVHSVLEHLFDLPAAGRTPEAAIELMPGLWQAQREADPSVDALFDDPAQQEAWMRDAEDVVRAYFQIEDPKWLEPAEREEHVQVVTRDGIRLRGFIDRVDRAPSGAERVVDYKTGKAPKPRYQDEALFQMRFYALMLRELRQLPARLQLLYIKSGRVLTLDPTPEEIDLMNHQVTEGWNAIEADARRGQFAPRKNPLCNWCGVRAQCPLFGGETPPLPEEGVDKLLKIRVDSQETRRTRHGSPFAAEVSVDEGVDDFARGDAPQHVLVQFGQRAEPREAGPRLDGLHARDADDVRA